ncbi:MAG TPA: hypothetical protein VFG87_19860 [Amycolatopsis sp.]|nr:hypothetical protein [Amycolatopsis sp.]
MIDQENALLSPDDRDRPRETVPDSGPVRDPADHGIAHTWFGDQDVLLALGFPASGRRSR